VYGTKRPLCYTDHYNLIDIPIHFFVSMDDMLIRADDIAEHYHILKKHDPNLAHMKVFKGFSHVDMVCFSQHKMISELSNTLKGFIQNNLYSNEDEYTTDGHQHTEDETTN